VTVVLMLVVVLAVVLAVVVCLSSPAVGLFLLFLRFAAPHGPRLDLVFAKCSARGCI
jgi:hypothetical protein